MPEPNRPPELECEPADSVFPEADFGALGGGVDTGEVITAEEDDKGSNPSLLSGRSACTVSQWFRKASRIVKSRSTFVASVTESRAAEVVALSPASRAAAFAARAEEGGVKSA